MQISKCLHLTLLITLLMFTCLYRTGDDAKTQAYHARNVQPSWKVSLFEIFRGFSRIGIIVGYAFLCDRYAQCCLVKI